MLGDALTCDVESGAVIDGTAVNRQAERHIHRRVEGHELDRDVTLVVVLRDDEIESP